MALENDKLKSDDDDRRRLTILITLALLPFAFAIYYFFAHEPDRPQLHHALSPFAAEQTERVHELCQSLPKPEKLEFMNSSEDGGIDSSMVIYRYNSIRQSAEILPTFLVWFNENGWQHVPFTDTTFRKGHATVYISAMSTTEKTFYIIYCSEKDS